MAGTNKIFDLVPLDAELQSKKPSQTHGGVASIARVHAARRLNLHAQCSGYPTAILHFNALSLGPLAHLGGVQPARRSPARATRRPPGRDAGPPGSAQVAGQGIPQLLGMPGVQVDLVVRAV